MRNSVRYTRINPQWDGVTPPMFPRDFPGCKNRDDISVTLADDGWFDVVTATKVSNERDAEEAISRIAPSIERYERQLKHNLGQMIYGHILEFEGAVVHLKRLYRRECLIHGDGSKEAGAIDRNLCALQSAIELLQQGIDYEPFPIDPAKMEVTDNA